MNADESTAPAVRARSSNANAAASLSDVVDILKQVAGLYSNPRFGNPATAAAIVRLARALGRLGDLDLDAALSRLEGAKQQNRRITASSRGRLVGRNLSALTLDEVQELIEAPDIQRLDLVHIAVERFVLSRAALGRMKTAAIKDALQAAARNERSLDAISRQASRQERSLSGRSDDDRAY